MKLKRNVHQVVTWGDWCVSYSTGDHIQGAILHVYRTRIGSYQLNYERWLYGYGNMGLFDSVEDAKQWAFDHGYLQLYFAHPTLRAGRKAEHHRVLHSVPYDKQRSNRRTK